MALLRLRAGDLAALDVVALPMPIDAGPPPADAATAVASLDAAPAPALATLDVITRPAGAKVRVRGGAALTTPATLALPAGTVTVGISRDGYAPIERTVELTETVTPTGRRYEATVSIKRPSKPHSFVVFHARGPAGRDLSPIYPGRKPFAVSNPIFFF